MEETTNEGGTGATGAGASNASPHNAGTNLVPQKVAAEEAHILEEHIVSPPKAPARTPVPSSALPTPTSTFSPAALTPPIIPVTPPVSRPPAPLSPSFSARPQVPASAHTGVTAQSDIAQILEGIKLPQRREPLETKPTPAKQTYDTSLTVDPQKQAAAEATRATALQNAQEAAQAINEKLGTPGKPQDNVRALHTLKDDLQTVVRDKKISLVRAVALEEEKKYKTTASEEQLNVQTTRQKRTRFTFFFVGLLAFVGLCALGAVLFIMSERTSKSAGSVPVQVLFAEQTVPLPIDTIAPADIRRQIASARNSGALTLGAILQIVPVTNADNGSGQSALTPVSFSAFIRAIGAEPPSGLLGALDDQFFFGIHTVDENAPILVVPVTSYERAFAGMLAWEKTMNQDLSPMFTSLSMQKASVGGLIEERSFEDTVMRNYDVRALKDDSGTIQLYYSFPTRNVLIIAESPYSFSEILSRLKADRKL